MRELKKDLKYKPRKEQQEALNFIGDIFKNKPDLKHILLDLPVGIGKSYLALMVADWYKKNIDKTAKFDILTNSKYLQQQYTEEFNSIQSLAGKDNYDCEQYACSCSQGKEFNRLNKTSCESCPYDRSKNGFIAGDISLTNFHLYILYALYMPDFIKGRGAKVLIVDEAHDFDQIFSDFISISVTEPLIKRLQFSNDKQIISDLQKVKNVNDYVIFLKDLVGEIHSTVSDVEKLLGSSVKNSGFSITKRNQKVSKVFNEKTSDVKLMSTIADLKQLELKIEVFLKEYKEQPENWVLESNWNEKTKQTSLSLEPIWAYNYLDKYIWSNYDHVIMMSGTILDKNLFSYLNGLDVTKTAYYSIPSPFPAANRPIYYMPVGRMTYTNKVSAFKQYVPYLKKLLAKYKNHKGIIHTNSFELASWIKKDVKDKRLLFHESDTKAETLRKHFDTEDPTVVVSPSVSTGVSFDNDRSRFQIIAKIPYPSLASQKNKMRQKMMPEWYSWRTIASLIQMTGRSVRSASDYADTIIIDSCFSDIMKYSSHLLPQYIQDAIKKINIKEGAN